MGNAGEPSLTPVDTAVQQPKYLVGKLTTNYIAFKFEPRLLPKVDNHVMDHKKYRVKSVENYRRIYRNLNEHYHYYIKK